MRLLAHLLVAGVLALGGSVTIAATNARAAGPAVTGAAALFQGGNQAYARYQPLYGVNPVVRGRADSFEVVVNGPRPFLMSFTMPLGRSFGVGHYFADNAPGRPYVGFTAGGIYHTFTGEMQVLDWAVGSNGVPSRFDIVFYDAHGAGVFGQVRYGQDTAETVAIATTRPTWGTTPVGSIPIVATEYLHNLSTTPVTIGAATVSGSAKADYVVGANGCSGRTLAAGGSCTLTIGFSPKQAGPRIAALSIAIGGVTKRVALSGRAALGSSRITISGDDYVTGGGTRSYADAGASGLAASRQPNMYKFNNFAPYSDTADTVHLAIAGVNGSKPTVGRHLVDATSTDPAALYLTVSSRGRGFSNTAGTATVRRFDVDAYDRTVAADVDFVLWDKQDPLHQLTGSLRWRARTDYTAPAAPTALSVSTSGTGRTATWTPSTATSVARVVAGDGAGATPVDGYPVASGSATSGTLPALRKGRTYTLMVFAVDTAGNAGKPVKKSFVA